MDAEDNPRDFYIILNVSRTSNKDEIKSQYMHFAKLLHPDKSLNSSNSDMFQKVHEAYKVLSDDNARKIYDELGYHAVKEFMNHHEKYSIGEYDKLHANYTQKLKQNLARTQEMHDQSECALSGLIHPQLEITYDDTNFPKVYLKSLQNQTNLAFPLTKSLSLILSTVGGLVLPQLGQPTTGLARLGFGLNYEVNQFTQISTMTTFSSSTETPSFQATISRKLSNIMSLGLITAYDANSGLNLQFQLTRQLSSSLTCINTLSPTSYVLELVHVNEMSHKSAWQNSIVCNAGTQPGMTYSSTLKANAMEYKLKTSIGMPVLFEVSFGAKTAHESVLQKGVQMNWNPVMGFGLSLLVRRSQLSLVLPIPLGILGESKTSTRKAADVAFMCLLMNGFNYWSQQRRIAHKKDKRKQIEANKEVAKEEVHSLFDASKRVRTLEVVDNGLIILSAVYGRLGKDRKALDVTLQLQFLVKNSEIDLPNCSKTQLLGFFNPTMDNDVLMCLQIRYRLGNFVFDIECDDIKPLHLPSPRAMPIGRFSESLEYNVTKKEDIRLDVI